MKKTAKGNKIKNIKLCKEAMENCIPYIIICKISENASNLSFANRKDQFINNTIIVTDKTSVVFLSNFEYGKTYCIETCHFANDMERFNILLDKILS
jgi:hypothetical protein